MRRFWESIRLRGADGQSVILFAIALPLIALVALLVVDGSNEFAQKTSIQGAADAAAMAAAEGIADGTCADNTCIGNITASYSYLNGAIGAPTPGLPQCASASSTNCYVFPYGGAGSNKVEVRLRKDVSTFLGGVIGITKTSVAARAVGGVVPGPPPPYTFASLNTSCDNHTLVIRSGGNLTVTNAMYINSCNSPQDAFDIFGTGGKITDLVNIFVHGGWETHNASTVWVGNPPTQCPLAHSVAPLTNPQPAGCPKTGQPVLADPFAGKINPPALDAVGITTNCTATNPCYNLAPYSPSQLLVGSITSGQTQFTVHGNQIANKTWISIDGELMNVTANPAAASPPNPPNGKLLTVGSRGVLTTAAPHTLPTAIPIVTEQRVAGIATLTTSSPHDLDVGDWVNVTGLSDSSFNGVYQVTDIPDDETSGPKQFSYDQSSQNLPDVGGVPLTGVSRSGGVATITAAGHNLSAGDPVVVGVTSVNGATDTSFDEDAEDGARVDSVPAPTSNTFSYDQDPGLPDVHGPTTPIKTIFRFGNVASIVTTANHNLPNGEQTVVTAPSPTYTSFNGTFPISVVGNTQFTYPNSGADLNASAGTKTVTTVSRLNDVATVTLSGTLPAGGAPALSTTFPNNVIGVNLTGVDTSFNGTFPITSLTNGNKTFTYANTGPDTTAPPQNVLNESRVGTTVTMTLQAAPTFVNGAHVKVTLTGGDFNGTFTVTKIGGAGNPPNSFQYTDPGTAGNNQGFTGTVADTAAGVDVTPPNTSTADHKIGVDISAQGGTIQDVTAPATGDVSGQPADVTGQGGTVQGPLFEVFNAVGGGDATHPPPKIVGSSPSAPVEYAVPAGTSQTLNPGTYYGGICIGAPGGAHCGAKVGGSCTPSAATPATVTMNPGIYIMAGGGFYVCGNTAVAMADPNNGVMIYNTKDAQGGAALAAQIDQVEFNTNGNVDLEPQTTGAYPGLTIYQGPDPASAASPNPDLQLSATKCDNRALKLTDIAFVKTGNGLNAFHGTIYAPAQDALFADYVSGRANLAVLTGCIFISGATSIFDFQSGGLFGLGPGLSE
jgi:hypothetical protein